MILDKKLTQPRYPGRQCARLFYLKFFESAGLVGFNRENETFIQEFVRKFCITVLGEKYVPGWMCVKKVKKEII